jgi:hypothetical protein
MENDVAEKAKARRHQRILLVCVAVGVILPLVLLYLTHWRTAP